ncbi:MAG: hypothetical protein ISQ83_07210 [Alphaproteobacteria bacterium]|nr:hypothetical protein [Alphaproteobacteria bacterium]
MSNITDLIKKSHHEKPSTLDIKLIEKKYNWVFEKNKNCIISPDSDGIMSALLMSKYLNWKVKGFYDGKILLFHKDILPKDCIFLDMEIAISSIKSVGQHLVVPYQDIYKEFGHGAFENCLSPNQIRGYDKKFFRLKFPMATVHFLISILHYNCEIKLSERAIYPLLFTDGLFNVLFSYPENVADWFNFLKINSKDNPLNIFFYQNKNTITHIMKGMQGFFDKRDECGGNKKIGRGDKLIISNKNGDHINLSKSSNFYNIDEENTKNIKKFIKIICDEFEWEFNENDFVFNDFNLIKFEKDSLNSTDNNKKNLTKENVKEIYKKKIFSSAQTAGSTFEFTYLGNMEENKDLFY